MAERWKQLNVHQLINKLWCINTQNYNLALKRNYLNNMKPHKRDYILYDSIHKIS